MIRRPKNRLTSHRPTFGGFFSNEENWGDIEPRWRAENKRAGVTRFHASHVNARDGEFLGWSKGQQIEYSANLMKILCDQGRYLHTLSCAIWASDYFRIINEYGRRKMGHPYVACFNSCIALVAQEMEVRRFPEEDQFSVILDRNEFENKAVESFYAMKDSKEWPYRHRLATCAPGSTEDFVPLECADLIAYETFRLVHDRASAEKTRHVLRTMFKSNGFLGHATTDIELTAMKWDLEHARCADNRFVVQHTPLDPFGEE